MTTFKNAMVALDLSPMDDRLLSYADYITNLLATQRIYLVHVIPNSFELLDAGTRYFQPTEPTKPKEPAATKVKEYIQSKMSKHFKQHQRRIDTDVNILTGNTYKKLIYWTQLKSIDLLIVGKKDTHKIPK